MIDFGEIGDFKQAPAPENWKKAEGHIILSNFMTETYQIANQTSINKNKNSTVGLVKRKAKLRYEYSVNGQSYSSSRYSFGKSHLSADRLIARYPLGKEVSVFYNQDKPKQGVLVPGVKGSSIAANAVGGIVLLVLSIMGFAQVRRNKQTAN